MKKVITYYLNFVLWNRDLSIKLSDVLELNNVCTLVCAAVLLQVRSLHAARRKRGTSTDEATAEATTTSQL